MIIWIPLKKIKKIEEKLFGRKETNTSVSLLPKWQDEYLCCVLDLGWYIQFSGEFGIHTTQHQHEEHGDAIDEGLTLSSPKWP